MNKPVPYHYKRRNNQFTDKLTEKQLKAIEYYCATKDKYYSFIKAGYSISSKTAIAKCEEFFNSSLVK